MEPPFDEIPEFVQQGPPKTRERVNPAMSIGARLAAIEECRVQIEALTRRIEEHGQGIAIKAAVLRGEL